MSQISTCPRCRLQVSLPAKASPAAQVKCPLCSAEYALQEALNEVPPMLIVLDPGPVEAAVLSGTAVGAELNADSTGMLPEVEFPDTDEAAGSLPHFADDEDIAGAVRGGEPDDEAHGDAEGRLSLGDEAPDESGAMIGGALRDGDAADEAHGGFDLSRADGGAPRTGSRRGQRSSGGFAEMIKAVMGAVIGLAIGYYILLLLGRDPMQLKPFLHTYLPDWLVP
jgi:hypothetical protein